EGRAEALEEARTDDRTDRPGGRLFRLQVEVTLEGGISLTCRRFGDRTDAGHWSALSDTDGGQGRVGRRSRTHARIVGKVRQAARIRGEQLGDVRCTNRAVVRTAELEVVNGGPAAGDLPRRGVELRAGRRVDCVVRPTDTAFELELFGEPNVRNDRRDDFGEAFV